MICKIGVKFRTTHVNLTACSSVFPVLSIEQNYPCISHRTVKEKLILLPGVLQILKRILRFIAKEIFRLPN